MKTNRPINDFLHGMKSFHPHDVAVLFCLIGQQEVLGEIPHPKLRDPLWSVDLENVELRDAVDRLVQHGEIAHNNGLYSVARYPAFLESIKEFGHRAWNRDYKRKRKVVA